MPFVLPGANYRQAQQARNLALFTTKIALTSHARVIDVRSSIEEEEGDTIHKWQFRRSLGPNFSSRSKTPSCSNELINKAFGIRP